MTEQEDNKTKKIYYSMGEVAEIFDVNQSLIRFWEGKFDILKPHKNKKGNRMFTPSDMENLKVIYHLVKERGMTLAGAQKVIKENKKDLLRDAQIAERLMNIKSMLLEIRQELNAGEDDIVLADAEYVASTIEDAALQDVVNKDNVATECVNTMETVGEPVKYDHRPKYEPVTEPQFEVTPIQEELFAEEVMAETQEEPAKSKPIIIEQSLF